MTIYRSSEDFLPSLNFIKSIDRIEAQALCGDQDTYIAMCDIKASKTISDATNIIAKELNFPAYFNSNVADSFDECIRSLSWIDQRNILVLVNGCGNIAATNFNDFMLILDMLLNASSVHSERGRTLKIIILANG